MSTFESITASLTSFSKTSGSFLLPERKAGLGGFLGLKCSGLGGGGGGLDLDSDFPLTEDGVLMLLVVDLPFSTLEVVFLRPFSENDDVVVLILTISEVLLFFG